MYTYQNFDMNQSFCLNPLYSPFVLLHHHLSVHLTLVHLPLFLLLFLWSMVSIPLLPSLLNSLVFGFIYSQLPCPNPDNI